MLKQNLIAALLTLAGIADAFAPMGHVHVPVVTRCVCVCGLAARTQGDVSASPSTLTQHRLRSQALGGRVGEDDGHGGRRRLTSPRPLARCL
jgi:hypothetical protein